MYLVDVYVGIVGVRTEHIWVDSTDLLSHKLLGYYCLVVLLECKDCINGGAAVCWFWAFASASPVAAGELAVAVGLLL